jgi:hypothetical protein
VRSWVLAANPGRDAAGLTMYTPLIRERWLTSLRITDLLLLVEELRGAPLDPRTLVPGAFRDLATIERTFLPQEPR